MGLSRSSNGLARRTWVTAGFVLIGCGPLVGATPEGESAGDSDATAQTDGPSDPTVGPSNTTSTSTSTSTSTGTTTSPATSDGPVSTVTTTTDGTEESSGIGSETGDDTFGKGFICHHCQPDGGGLPFECDPWSQDCPRGEKCSAWANDGGNAWNATRCSPVQPDPDAPGDACTVEGSAVSGVDSCELGSMCFHVDPKTNTGECVELCEGSEADPSCGDGLVCSISNAGALNLCILSCDPLMQDCPEGEGCQPFGESFTCLPTGEQPGAYGDACEFLASCQPGLFCIDAQQLPNCDAAGCCTTFCPLDGDASVDCPEFPQTQCRAAYEEGSAPPGLELLGYCAI